MALHDTNPDVLTLLPCTALSQSCAPIALVVNDDYEALPLAASSGVCEATACEPKVYQSQLALRFPRVEGARPSSRSASLNLLKLGVRRV